MHISTDLGLPLQADFAQQHHCQRAPNFSHRAVRYAILCCGSAMESFFVRRCDTHCMLHINHSYVRLQGCTDESPITQPQLLLSVLSLLIRPPPSSPLCGRRRMLDTRPTRLSGHLRRSSNSNNRSKTSSCSNSNSSSRWPLLPSIVGPQQASAHRRAYRHMVEAKRLLQLR